MGAYFRIQETRVCLRLRGKERWKIQERCAMEPGRIGSARLAWIEGIER